MTDGERLQLQTKGCSFFREQLRIYKVRRKPSCQTVNTVGGRTPVFTTRAHCTQVFQELSAKSVKAATNPTYGSRSREEMIELSTLSVTLRRLSMDASNLFLTSGQVRACSVVTSYGSLLETQQRLSVDLGPGRSIDVPATPVYAGLRVASCRPPSSSTSKSDTNTANSPTFQLLFF